MSENSQLDLASLFAQLSAPLPLEAIETDSSRGFALTGIKGAYVIERLNQVLGLCGTGWCFSICSMEITDKFVLADIELQYRIDGEWSKPIPSSGEQMIVRGRVGDAKKGAVTDAIKKAAGMLGVGNEAYKGLLTPSVNGARKTNAVWGNGKPEPTRAPAKRAAKAAPKPRAPVHWIDDDTTRKRFWAYVKDDLGLTEEQVHTGLNVAHMRDFPGTREDAKAFLDLLAGESPFSEPSEMEI